MRTWFLSMLTLIALTATPVRADDAKLKEQVVGNWKLVSVEYEDQQTKARSPVLGAKPRGYQIATADGLWLALVTAEGRPVPKTDEDRAKALRTMISYSGRYRVEDGKVVTKVEVAWNEAWVGGGSPTLGPIQVNSGSLRIQADSGGIEISIALTSHLIFGKHRCHFVFWVFRLIYSGHCSVCPMLNCTHVVRDA